MILLKSISDAENRSLLPAEVNVATEDLENAEAAHAVSLWRLSWRRKKKRMRRDFGFWMFDFFPRLRDTLTRGLRIKEGKNGVHKRREANKGVRARGSSEVRK